MHCRGVRLPSARGRTSTSRWSACCSTPGPGPAWSFVEPQTALRLTRSEGLGVASFRAFMAGAFSARRDDPLRVDAAALATIDAAGWRRCSRRAPDNPLVGLEGRAALLRRLGGALTRHS